jgi:hypothetical protein
MVTGMHHQYKYEALLTVYPGGDGSPCEKLGRAPRRMVVRGHDAESHRNQLYNALVSCDDEGPFQQGHSQLLVTLRVAGDDVPEYLHAGSEFELWQGNDVGKGIITRRLFV